MPGESCPCCVGGRVAEPWWLQLSSLLSREPGSPFAEVLAWSCGQWDGIFLPVLFQSPSFFLESEPNVPNVFCGTAQEPASPLEVSLLGMIPSSNPLFVSFNPSNVAE